ncbi:hypothetical protein SPI_02757 [Niveomyces insectorum RCEF 264]|uniref:Glycosyltransferase 2 n=1 Tax=Niveomyces insectorum RCEF 264 TaxID=1081102 RepID=A0A162MRY4_9HYPO|nr:hypothetical protein SPI_02757 [Niveomyces insectorum RCEF 264]
MQGLFLSDVELGKKDDDHNRPRSSGGSGGGGGGGGIVSGIVGSVGVSGLSGGGRTPTLAFLRVQPRKLLRRFLFVFLVAAAVYLFIRHLPSDLPIRDRRRPVYKHQVPGDGQAGGGSPAPYMQGQQQQPYGNQGQSPPPSSPRGGSAKAGKGGEPPGAGIPEPASGPAVYSYNGPLRFLALGTSLRAITRTHGGYQHNKNVLFAAGSVQSIAALLPLACQMGSQLRSYVHFAVMSRSGISLDELQDINGIDASCNIFFHDARPDFASISIDKRMEKSVEMAMSHVELYMHPQAVIVDGSNTEEAYLLKGIRSYNKGSQAALIELPTNAAKRLGWLTTLDSASLSSWNKISVDILIHAYPGASGSLIRLLRSLSSADFGAGPVPHLTIELPQTVDPPTDEFLKTFQWPPADAADVAGTPTTRHPTLRHRIPKHGVREEESSVRFLESFWPANLQYSHVLVLSPQTELAPDFFSYVKYALLEYRYSNAALLQEWDKRLFGLSLALPSTALDGTTTFTPPFALKKQPAAGTKRSTPPVAVGADGEGESKGEGGGEGGGPTSFLWQAPNSNAVLFLGERWVELHRFVAQLLETQQAEKQQAEKQQPEQQQQQQTDLLLTEKRVSKRFPAWLEHALRLCRARGLWLVYPSAPVAGALATVHNELYQPPEEYAADDDVAGVREEGDAVRAHGDEVRLGSRALLDTLLSGRRSSSGSSSGLAPFSDLPLLAWDGQPATLADIDEQAAAYANRFRRTVGGCTEGMLSALRPETLFCNEDD